MKAISDSDWDALKRDIESISGLPRKGITTSSSTPCPGSRVSKGKWIEKTTLKCKIMTALLLPLAAQDKNVAIAMATAALEVLEEKEDTKRDK